MVECKLPKLDTRVRFPSLAFLAFSDRKGQKTLDVLRSRNGQGKLLKVSFQKKKAIGAPTQSFGSFAFQNETKQWG